MMFLFAYLGSKNAPSGWPVHLMHQTEAAFVIVALVCVLLAGFLKKTATCVLVAVIGGISAGFGLIMPLELAPFFFGARGEIMLGTVALILVYPIAVALFIVLFLMFMKPTRDKIRNS
jgi:thiosulfate dehydrogenase (quinone) large subunit